MGEPEANERLIVALDVPSPDEAYAVVEQLDGIVSFYKVGPELLLTGGMYEILKRLIMGHKVFVDLKVGDISETVRRVVDQAANLGVRFITLSPHSHEATVKAAVDGRGSREYPKILFVSYLSSMDEKDFAQAEGAPAANFEQFLVSRTQEMLAAGCDGFIASGHSIKLLRNRYKDAIIVSPGIRPKGSSIDDHKRFTTPAEAIQMGANYIVVGRPILKATDRARAARAIVDEIEKTLTGRSPGSARARTAQSVLRPHPAI